MNATPKLRLGVNIDHVATIRNARGGAHPDPVRAARLAAQAGADSITAHLREDRRHISDDDIERLRRDIDLPLNLEMAATDEMLAIALRHRPHAACLVPERRAERTTEGGLDVRGQHSHLAPFVRRMCDAGIQVALFVEPEPTVLDLCKSLGAPAIELHTGAYCEAMLADRAGEAARRELARLRRAAEHAAAALENARGQRAALRVEPQPQCGRRGFGDAALRTEQHGQRVAAFGGKLQTAQFGVSDFIGPGEHRAAGL